MRKWRLNNCHVLGGIHQQDHSTNVVNFGPDESVKTVGLAWPSNFDILKYNIRPFLPSNKTTKRIISESAEIFDHLGLLISPCTVLVKVIMQKLWSQKVSWDESISPEINSSWLRFRNELKHLYKLKISRRVICSDQDASEMAFGACVYIISINSDGQIFVILICVKTRVAPLKTITTPRLDLSAALLLSQLTNKMVTSMKLNFSAIYHWTDSIIVLSWIRSTPRVWKIFVSNRVKSWNYVHTKSNPTDVLSRGVESKHIKNLKLWWEGPD